MNGQTRGNRLTGRRAGRLAGAVGLLLALVLIAGGLLPVPATAQGDIPPMPHGFEGAVSILDPPGPVVEGTVVEAFVDGVKTAETNVDAQSRYLFLVPGPGVTVTFKVGGVLANESATWESGKLEVDFDLTIDEPPGFELTVNSTAGGSVTQPGEGTFLWAEAAVVDLVAQPEAGYQFDKWTGDVGTIVDVNAASTTITMNDSYSITANFEEGYTLTLATSPVMGGTATDVTGASSYEEGEVVSIQAVAASGYQFARWTATAGAFSNANAASTIFQMPGADVTVTATFEVATNPFGCFIATAAYGSPTAEEIEILREFRDTVLLPNSLGAEFVSLYYKTSPPIAEFISQHEVVRTAVRVGLVDPIVAILSWSYDLWGETG